MEAQKVDKPKQELVDENACVVCFKQCRIYSIG